MTTPTTTATTATVDAANNTAAIYPHRETPNVRFANRIANPY